MEQMNQMEHLSVEEMIEFVSFDELNEETLRLGTKVNGHIGVCEECLQKVRAFQGLYEAFVERGREKRLRSGGETPLSFLPSNRSNAARSDTYGEAR